MIKIYQEDIKFHYPMFFHFLGKGMEGTVWKTSNNLAYKKFIHLGYHAYEQSKLKKIEILNQLPLENCCIPLAIVVDKRENFQGYLMNLEHRGYYIQKLNIEDQISCLLVILHMIEEQKNLPVPIYNLDLSFQNIFINKQKQPIFIDLDNFYVDHIPPESYPPKLKYCTQIYSCEHSYDFQLLCFSLYIVEVISKTDIDFSLNRGISNIQKEVNQKIYDIIKKYQFTDSLMEDFIYLFRSNYKEVTIEEISNFLCAFKNHVKHTKQILGIKKYIKK